MGRGAAGCAVSADDELESAVTEALETESGRRDYHETLFSEGTVITAAYLRTEIVTMQGGRRKWAVWFDVLNKDDQPSGLTILRFYNEPRRGHYLSRSHSMYGDMFAVTRMPRFKVPKKAAPAAIVGTWLKGCIVQVRTRVVGRRMDADSRQPVETPSEQHYSVVDAIVGLCAGTPPLLQRRGGTLTHT